MFLCHRSMNFVCSLCKSKILREAGHTHRMSLIARVQRPSIQIQAHFSILRFSRDLCIRKQSSRERNSDTWTHFLSVKDNICLLFLFALVNPPASSCPSYVTDTRIQGWSEVFFVLFVKNFTTHIPLWLTSTFCESVAWWCCSLINPEVRQSRHVISHPVRILASDYHPTYWWRL